MLCKAAKKEISGSVIFQIFFVPSVEGEKKQDL